MNNNSNNNDGNKDTPVQKPILVRIDNLPPGKSWKEVRYLIGGIVHHSNVIQVKMLPLMSSIVPPFVPFQSCIVTLKPQLDPESLSELLVNLNTYQWHYYNLYAYTLPPLDAMQQFMPMLDQTTAIPPSGNKLTHDEVSISPSSLSDHTELKTPNGTPSLLYPTPIPAPAPPPIAPAGPATPAMISLPPGPGSGPGPMSPFGTLNGGIPAMTPQLPFMGMGPGPPRRQYYQPNMYGSGKFGGASGGLSSTSSGRNSHRNSSGGENIGADNKPPAPDRYMAAAAAATSATTQGLNDSSRGNITNSNSKRLKQIFNERTFRKQMTGRKMSQLQISGFPPFIKLDSWEPIQPENYRSLGEKGVQLIETDQPEKYGRLRWTILKDYVKLKCPRLLSLQEEDSSVENNTREFYVGVYEDHEEPIGIKIAPNEQESPEYGLSSATVYKAIVGFNNSELCDSCMDALRDQEYSLGYKLEIKALPPYEEEQQRT